MRRERVRERRLYTLHRQATRPELGRIAQEKRSEIAHTSRGASNDGYNNIDDESTESKQKPTCREGRIVWKSAEI